MAITDNDYTEFSNVDSGEGGTVEGLLEIDGAASAFRYRKEIVVVVILPIITDSVFRDITGKWKVRIRESASKDQNGAYNAPILFEQEVTWTARVTALSLGGIALVTWQPLGAGGSGFQQTSVCSGEQCATIANINNATPEELENYGTSGAWRFLDTGISQENSTPAQKYAAESGFSLFQDEGTIAIVGYKFYATWQSNNYISDPPIPEGAILETVFDQFQVGTLDQEAAYTFSYKAGSSDLEVLVDPRVGYTWALYRDSSNLKISTTRRGEDFETSEDDPVVATGSPRNFALLRHLSTLYTVYEAGDLSLAYSRDEGASWTTMLTISNITQIGKPTISADGSIIYILGKTKNAIAANATTGQEALASGEVVRVHVKRNNNGTWGTTRYQKVNGEVPSNASLSGTYRTGTEHIWVAKDGNDLKVYSSKDELASFSGVPSTEISGGGS